MKSTYACSFKGYAIHQVLRADNSRYYIIISKLFEGKVYATITDCEYAILSA